MKNIILLLLTILIFACTKQVPEKFEENSAIVYDSIKVMKYGADQYGMKKYVMAYLKRGPNRDRDSSEAAELQVAHLKNITRMAEEGKLVLAGPFLDDGDVRGIYIFDVETIEEAKALTETDPAIKAGSLVMELRPWYGSAALKEILTIHRTLEKKSVSGE
jgi:uncharacterized protein YciI